MEVGAIKGNGGGSTVKEALGSAPGSYDGKGIPVEGNHGSRHVGERPAYKDSEREESGRKDGPTGGVGGHIKDAFPKIAMPKIPMPGRQTGIIDVHQGGPEHGNSQVETDVEQNRAGSNGRGNEAWLEGITSQAGAKAGVQLDEL